MLSSAALCGLVLPLVEGRERGLAVVVDRLVADHASLCRALFRRYEVRLAKAGGDPLVPMEIFNRPACSEGSAPSRRFTP